MRVLPIFPSNWFEALIPALGVHGVQAVQDKPDAIIVGSISQLSRALEAMEKYPSVPMFAYNWDLYEWSRRSGGYDYKAWGKVLRHSREVWHPGPATLKRCKDWYGIGGTVIPTFVPVDHIVGADVEDGGYAMMAIRESPDPGRQWFADACGELGIPSFVSDLKLQPWEFKMKLAKATLLVNPLREASTGGLALIEGLSLGKPSLVSASPWNDGAFYLGPYAHKPKIDSYEAFRDELGRMWEERKTHDPIATRAFIKERYSLEVMSGTVAKRIGL